MFPSADYALRPPLLASPSRALSRAPLSWASAVRHCQQTPVSQSPIHSALRRRRLLRPLLTSRSASRRRAFTHKARSPRVRTHSFTARPPDLRRLILDHKSFATSGPLALIGTALYPVLVHRPAVSIHASSPRSVALSQLRFTSLAVVSSREDLHLQECARAGRTKKNGPVGPFFAFVLRLRTHMGVRSRRQLPYYCAAAAGAAAAAASSSSAFIDRRMRPCLSTSSTLTRTMSPSLSLSETFSTRSLEICETCTNPSLPGQW